MPTHLASSAHRSDRERDRAGTGAAGSSAGFGAAGVVAGTLAVTGSYPVLLGVVATGIGLVALVAALRSWTRARLRRLAGAPSTERSISGVAAGATAVTLGLLAVGVTAGAAAIGQGADALEHETDRLQHEIVSVL